MDHGSESPSGSPLTARRTVLMLVSAVAVLLPSAAATRPGGDGREVALDLSVEPAAPPTVATLGWWQQQQDEAQARRPPAQPQQVVVPVAGRRAFGPELAARLAAAETAPPEPRAVHWQPTPSMPNLERAGSPEPQADVEQDPDAQQALATVGLSNSFIGLGDNNTSIPPDTHGAVGPDHLMVMINTQVRVMDRTGTFLSTVSLDTFWTAGTGLSGDPFDPRLLYDPVSDRWIATVDADPRLPSSEVWLAISDDSDPTGNWTFFSFEADSTDTNWADFPGFGVNDNWIAIVNNMFTVSGSSFAGVKMWVIDKSTALAGGPLTTTIFPEGFDTSGGFFSASMQPAQHLDSNGDTLFIVDNAGFSDGGGVNRMRLSRITGTPASPSWSTVPGSTIAASSGMFSVDNDFQTASTMIDASQAGTATRVATNDQRITNTVVRHGDIFTSHHAGLPDSASASVSDRTACFWYQLDADDMANSGDPIVQSGVIDPGVDGHCFFPSISVNYAEDVLLGFSLSDPTRFVSAAVAGRNEADPAGALSMTKIYRHGQDSYVKDFGTGTVRWGDYSATVVDPRDDMTFWALQEAAENDVGPLPSHDRWAVWWAKGIPEGTSIFKAEAVYRRHLQNFGARGSALPRPPLSFLAMLDSSTTAWSERLFRFGPRLPGASPD